MISSSKQAISNLLMNAYQKLHIQLDNYWSVIPDTTDKPCEIVCGKFSVHFLPKKYI